MIAAAVLLALLAAPGPSATPGPAGRGWDPATWVRPSEAELRARLTLLQYRVTQEEWTEPPFRNAYDHNTLPGIYVDVVSGEPLFSSLQKFDSGTGWPSFWKPLEPSNIEERIDRHLAEVRIEVRSVHAGSHLGHVFHDGPPPTGLRYCMNSAALRFIPAERLEAEGYPQYRQSFVKPPRLERLPETTKPSARPGRGLRRGSKARRQAACCAC